VFGFHHGKQAGKFGDELQEEEDERQAGGRVTITMKKLTAYDK
jgi:hypothetical protein